MSAVSELTIDIGLICVLLLIGVYLRAKVALIQRLFIPSSLIAGFLALAFGPNGLGWLPFSENIAEYPEILIAVIFGAIPLGAAKKKWRQTFRRVRNMWTYSLFITLLMWGGGVLVAVLALGPIWGTPDGFGLILGAGFVGGHGTAAAVGESLADLGFEEAPTLAYTSATIGLLAAILGGLLISKINVRKNRTSFMSDFDQLPDDLRTGLIPRRDRESSGTDTVSPNSVDPMFFQIAVIGLVVVVSFAILQGMEAVAPEFSVPLLSIAFIVGLIVHHLMRAAGGDKYLDKPTINRVGGTATDLTVAFGIASIDLAVTIDYLGPLIGLFVFGVLWAYGIFHFLSPRVFHQSWFENGLFGWGWSTGSVAMGIALLRVVDPQSRASTLQDYGIAYVGVVPVEVVIITFGPAVVMSGFGIGYFGVLLGAALILYIVARWSGWLVARETVKERRSGSAGEKT